MKNCRLDYAENACLALENHKINDHEINGA